MSPASQSFRFRESRRLLREAPVRLSVSGEGAELVARTRDIAVGGMFVATSEVRPVGTGTAFVLELGSEDAPDTVQGEATVVWVRETPGEADQPVGMGMQFTRVEPPGEERLAMLFSDQSDEAAGSDATEAAPTAPVEADDSAAAEEVETEVAEAEETGTDVPETAVDEAETDAPDRAGVKTGRPADEGEEAGETGTVGAVEAAEELASDAAASPEDSTTDDSEAGGTRAELFGDLAGDQDDWMNPASNRPSWVWPTVAGIILIGALLIFLRGPLTRLVGMGGNDGGEQPASVAESVEVPAPVRDAAPPADLPAAAGLSTDSSSDPVASEVPARSAPAQSPEPPARSSEPTTPPPEPVARPRPPAPSRSNPAPGAPSAYATALRAITASVQGDRTQVEMTGNAPFERHHAMRLDAPPRLLVRLIGVQRDVDATAVSAPRLRGVRTGLHGRGATRNLHVVLDLAAPNIKAAVERRGDRVVVHLSD